MKLTQYLRSLIRAGIKNEFFNSRRISDRGFTITEFLVATTTGLIVMAMALSTTHSNRNLLKYDLIRTRLNQHMRGALDIVGISVREAGENLTSGFPALEVIDGASGAPDELIVRRNLLDDVIKLCTAISAGSTTTDIVFAKNTFKSGCGVSDNISKFTAWQNYRTAEGGTAPAYMYDSVTGLGEFFEYTSETQTMVNLKIHRSAGTWANAYSNAAASAYLLEEWHFRVQDDKLQVVADGDSANPLNVIYGVSDFQVNVHMQDSTTKTSFNFNDDWTQIETVEVQITGEDSFRNETVSRTLSADFFPRNILSN